MTDIIFRTLLLSHEYQYSTINLEIIISIPFRKMMNQFSAQLKVGCRLHQHTSEHVLGYSFRCHSSKITMVHMFFCPSEGGRGPARHNALTTCY